MRSQIATSSWGGRRYRPLAFSEEGIAMLSSVLNNERAINVNIAIMRVFVTLRKVQILDHEFEFRISSLEAKFEKKFKNLTFTVRLKVLKYIL